MFYVWFDDLNEWRRRVFKRPDLAGDDVAGDALPVQRNSAL
jgi:hypothetical protein